MAKFTLRGFWGVLPGSFPLHRKANHGKHRQFLSLPLFHTPGRRLCGSIDLRGGLPFRSCRRTVPGSLPGVSRTWWGSGGRAPLQRIPDTNIFVGALLPEFPGPLGSACHSLLRLTWSLPPPCFWQRTRDCFYPVLHDASCLSAGMNVPDSLQWLCPKATRLCRWFEVYITIPAAYIKVERWVSRVITAHGEGSGSKNLFSLQEIERIDL